MNYLELVNLAINESGKEIDELDDTNFDSDFAGRRMYPRIKRAVAEAWKSIQIRRNEWEFSTAELSFTVYPRIVVDNVVVNVGPGPDIGTVYKGQDSGIVFTVVNVLNYTTPVLGMESINTQQIIEFTTEPNVNGRSTPGELFVEVSPNADDSEFTYIGRAGYRLSEISEFAREPHWSEFVGYQENNTPIPVVYIPWSNWVYKDISYTTSTQSVPSFVSQNYLGELVFYPQTLSPFAIDIVCDLAPQELEAWDDTPSLKLLPAELHPWIAYEALEQIARFDKDPDLLAYAQAQGKPYRYKAERNLLPIVSWRESNFNY